MKLIFAVVVLSVAIVIFSTDDAKSFDQSEISSILATLQTQNEQILKSNTKIQDDVEKIRDVSQENQTSISAIDTWREQQQINISRFYEQNWTSAEKRMLRLEKSLKEMTDLFNRKDEQNQKKIEDETIIVIFL